MARRAKIKVGDRIKFSAPTRYGAPIATRKVKALRAKGRVEVAFHGWPNNYTGDGSMILQLKLKDVGQGPQIDRRNQLINWILNWGADVGNHHEAVNLATNALYRGSAFVLDPDKALSADDFWCCQRLLNLSDAELGDRLGFSPENAARNVRRLKDPNNDKKLGRQGRVLLALALQGLDAPAIIREHLGRAGS